MAFFQQRGLEPSTIAGPFTIEQAVADIGSVIDGLGWERAWLVGHSWGGHLAFHAAVVDPRAAPRRPERRPLGGGRRRRGRGLRDAPSSSPGSRRSCRPGLQELDDMDDAGTATEADVEEMIDIVVGVLLRHARRGSAPMPPLAVSTAAPPSGCWRTSSSSSRRWRRRSSSITVPVAVRCRATPARCHRDAAQATVDRIPGAWAARGAGHGPLPLARAARVRSRSARPAGARDSRDLRGSPHACRLQTARRPHRQATRPAR